MEDNFRKILALNIRIERARRRMTQEKLAELSEISPKHITKIENAGATPSAYLLYRIARALNVSLDKLIREDDQD